MGDDYSKKDSPLSDNVDIHVAWERRYWSRVFGVNEVTLREAVALVGPHAEALRKHFRVAPKMAG
jgi:hypothetical protein